MCQELQLKKDWDGWLGAWESRTGWMTDLMDSVDSMDFMDSGPVRQVH